MTGVPDHLPPEGLDPRGARPELNEQDLERFMRDAALAFSEGLRAAGQRESVTTNPYPPDSIHAKAWAAAWHLVNDRGPGQETDP